MSKLTVTVDVEKLLREDIVAGRIGFGEQLRIGELAERYGVSHMPVREALRVLGGEGLVLAERNRSARVRPVHRGFVEDIFDIRTAIECLLARRAAERRSDAQIAELVGIEAGLEALVERGEYDRIPEANRAFHAVINQAAGNPGAMSLVDSQWLLVTALWNKYGNPPERFQVVIDDHRHMIAAIRRRDPAAASALMGAHVEKAKQDLLARMALVEPQGDEPAPRKRRA